MASTDKMSSPNRSQSITRRKVFLCICSAVAGGLTALIWQRPLLVDTPLVAQETAPWPATASAAPPRTAAVTLPVAQPPELAELTPEERVNVLVYQQANRSVVNINTTAVQGERFLLFEVVSEGEGSGTVIDRAGHVLTNFHVVDGAREIQRHALRRQELRRQAGGRRHRHATWRC